MEYPEPPYLKHPDQRPIDRTASEVNQKVMVDLKDEISTLVGEERYTLGRAVKGRRDSNAKQVADLNVKIDGHIEEMEDLRQNTDGEYDFDQLKALNCWAKQLQQDTLQAMLSTTALAILNLKCDGVIPLTTPEDYRGAPIP